MNALSSQEAIHHQQMLGERVDSLHLKTKINSEPVGGHNNILSPSLSAYHKRTD